MSHQDWDQVKDIFNAALRQKSEERPAFLDGVCKDDADLRVEVESLLVAFDEGKSFLERPLISQPSKKARWRLETGRIISHFKILSPIASGGMGEVYLAEDQKLYRQVALKVLPEHFSEDRDRMWRFQREAQAVSTLNHPNILTIFEFDEQDSIHIFASEFVEGETLRERLRRGSLPVSDCLDIGIQVASALQAAHAAGVIHRDVKPENIMIRRDGIVKVLDFGLAKLTENPRPSDTSDTHIEFFSHPGMILGTAAYMSPEQARAVSIDHRTDIFSLGVVLYEMIAGKPPFTGDTTADIIAAMIQSDPPHVKDVVPSVPAQLDAVIAKALEKDLTIRYGLASEILADLRRLTKGSGFEANPDNGLNEQHGPQTVSGPPSEQNLSHETVRLISESENLPGKLTPASDIANKTGPTWNKKTSETNRAWPNYSTVFSLAAVVLGAGVLVWALWQNNRTAETDAHSFDALRPVRLVSWTSGMGSFFTDYRLSHNDKMIAYSSTQSGDSEDIFVKQIDGDSREIQVTRDAWFNHSPIWSPDDQRIAYVSRRNDESGIYVSPSFGGAAVQLRMIGAGTLALRHWSRDGSAIFYELDGNLFKLDLETREIAQLTDIAASTDLKRYFSLSPDEERIAYCDNRDGVGDMWTMPLSGGAAMRLTNDADQELRPRWHPDGKRILYGVSRDDRSQINLAYLDGRPPIQITRGEGEYEIVDVSADGTKIFFTSWAKRSDINSVNVDTGEETEFVAAPEAEFWADFSPDGRSVLYQTNDSPHFTSLMPESSIIIKLLASQSPPLSFKGHNAQWLPENRRIAFLRRQMAGLKWNLWLFDTTSGEERQIISDGVNPPAFGILPSNRGEIGVFDWSPDAAKVAYLDSGRRNVWVASVEPFQASNLTNNSNPNLLYYSPLWLRDGKLVVFVSTEKSAERSSGAVSRVWLMESDKLREIFSTTESLRLLGWSGDELLLETAEGVMKATPSDVKLVRVSLTGEHQIVTTFKGIYARSMTLSRDGKAIAFAARQNDMNDIWTATVGRGEAKRVTNNRESRLSFSSLTFSPDGRTIFFDKQDQVSTISMFENFE